MFVQGETPDSLRSHLPRLILHLQLSLSLASSLLIARQLNPSYSSLKQDVHVDVAAELELNANSERYHHHYHHLLLPHISSRNTENGSHNDLLPNETSGSCIVIRYAFSAPHLRQFLTL